MKNTTYEVKKSEALLKKAKEVIPGGVFGHYKYAIRDTGPKFFSRAEGTYFVYVLCIMHERIWRWLAIIVL